MMPNRDSERPVKRTIADWLKVLILLLDEAAAVLVVILILHFMGIQIPLTVKIIIGLIAGIFIIVIHIAVIPSFRRKQVTGREGMLGLQVKAVEPLTPSGAIIVNGERWKAKSVDNNIDIDDDVEIVGIAGLTLKVRRLQR